MRGSRLRYGPPYDRETRRRAEANDAAVNFPHPSRPRPAIPATDHALRKPRERASKTKSTIPRGPPAIAESWRSLRLAARVRVLEARQKRRMNHNSGCVHGLFDWATAKAKFERFGFRPFLRDRPDYAAAAATRQELLPWDG